VVLLALVVTSVSVVLVPAPLAGPVLGVGSTAVAIAVAAAGDDAAGAGCHQGDYEQGGDP
jgi:hypothetical protein